MKDAAAAKAWVSKQLGGTQTTETYAGGEITIVSGLLTSNLAFAVRDNVLILGPEKTVKAALDTAGRERGRLLRVLHRGPQDRADRLPRRSATST